MKFKLMIIWYWLKFKQLRKINTRRKLEVYQQKSWRTFVNTQLILSPFYSKYKKSLLLDDYPVITKNEFMTEFDQINTKGISLESAMDVALEAERSRNFKSEIRGITIGLSTGTSGKRGIFLVSERERAIWTALVMNRVIKPTFTKKQKVAFFLRANSNLYESVKSRLFEFKYFDIFKPIPELMEELNRYQPDILAAQPSLLIEISEAQENLTIQISPKKVISFAEVLHENDKEKIETTFKQKITEIYQCTEGFLGCTCEHGTMHLNEDFMFVEKAWIDADHFYPIITDFTRTTQPVIRYKMNDVLKIKEDVCACGSPLLAIDKIIGRDDDILIFNSIKVFPDILARKIALSCNHYQQYTIVQDSSNSLLIGIECASEDYMITCQKFESTIRQYFKELGINIVEISFNNFVIHHPGDKLRKIKRLL